MKDQDKEDIIQALKAEIAELRGEIQKIQGFSLGHAHCTCHHNCCHHVHWNQYQYAGGSYVTPTTYMYTVTNSSATPAITWTNYGGGGSGS